MEFLIFLLNSKDILSVSKEIIPIAFKPVFSIKDIIFLVILLILYISVDIFKEFKLMELEKEE